MLPWNARLAEQIAQGRWAEHRAKADPPVYDRNGDIRGISEAEYIEEGQMRETLCVSAEEQGDIPAESSVGGGYYLYQNGEKAYVFDGDYRLV